MSVGRVLSSCAALLAVGGGVLVAVGMSRAATAPDAGETPYSMPSESSPVGLAWRPAPPQAAASAVSTARSSSPPSTSAPSRAPATTARSSAPRTPAARSSAPSTAGAAPRTTAAPTSAASSQPALVRGQALPVGGTTSAATRVITVVARSYGSTTATLQAWDRAPGGGWLKHGGPVVAHVGSDGLSTQPSETRSATPIGSFTLTQAFGALANPGTGLPYFHTDAADWWISQAGSLYNTHQHCSSGCAFTQGAPNEHLAYETPYYNYAVVIDYNTRNSPTGVRAGAGSAFFLHVTDGGPTAGCVAIPQSTLVSIMRWLTPAAHPRILIGVG
jgi:L,D-peptidoglycan transpeptidase YkuD (ErfK/YbiS/YcfS/YnhG family)